jgi:hypothetical protein
MSDYKLSEVIASYRTDRPDEWSMDVFIRGAIKLEAERDALKIELMRTEAALRACYNASAGALNLLTSDRQPKLEGKCDE